MQHPKVMRVCLLTANYTPRFITAHIMNMNIRDLTMLNIGEFFPDSFVKYEVVDYETPFMKGTVDVYHDPAITLKDGQQKTFLLISRTFIEEEMDGSVLEFFARLVEAYITYVSVFLQI